MMVSKVSHFVQDALYRKQAGYCASQAIIWGTVNSVVLSIMIYDLISEGYSKNITLLWWLAVGITIVCSINVIFHLRLYFLPHLTIAPLEVNEKQRKLLSVSEYDVGFKSPDQTLNTSTPTPESSPKLSELYKSTLRTPPPSHQPLNTNNVASTGNIWSPDVYTSPNNTYSSNKSFSPVDMSRSLNASSVSPSVTTNSWSYHRNQSSLLNTSYNVIPSPKRNVFSPSQTVESFLSGGTSPLQQVSSPLNSSIPFTSSPIHLLGREDTILSKDDLDNYLKEFSDKERKKQILSQSEISNGGGNSLWAYSGSSGSNYDFNSLRQNVYHVAIKDAGIETNSSLSKIDDAKRPYYSSNSVSKIWFKRNVSQKDLFKYEENMRIWLASNILQPLVQLIDSCNEALMAVAPELKVGNVGVDKLRKAAQNITGIKQLNYLIPFLDMTVHQDYLVQRLRELSKGGAISSFLWNSGRNFNGSPWRDEYPTDTYILLHLFSMYMDNHLPPDPTQPDGRVFSNIHVVKTPEKPTLPTTHPCLYLTQINPPHLKVILPPEEECEVGGGHKNCFHALILFCHHLVYQQHSHIAGVNLKLSGINLAWVVNAE